MSKLPDQNAVKAYVYEECTRHQRNYRVSRNEKKRGFMVFVCSSTDPNKKKNTEDGCPFQMSFKRDAVDQVWNLMTPKSCLMHTCEVASGKRRKLNAKDLERVAPFISHNITGVSVSISDAFDGGNIEYVRTEEDVVYLKVKADPFTELEQTNHMQYFSFRSRVNAEKDQKLTYVIQNAGECSFPAGWPEYKVFYSTNRTTWRRVLDTSYDAEQGHLRWSFHHSKVPLRDSVHFCYYPPYSYDRHLDLIAKCQSADGAIVKSIGNTLDGRELECITCGYGPMKAWIIHRQHPGDNMAEFFAEGLLTRLLGLNTDGAVDGLTKKALSLFTFHIVPNMNPDGAVRGYRRTNACGANLNHEWSSTGNYVAPSLKRSPEVYYVLKQMDKSGVDIFADIHGDEIHPFSFIAGTEGCPNWNERLKALHSSLLGAYCRANTDMQKEIGYKPEEFGKARMAVCSNQIAARFDCLAFTLEMPFKDCFSNPDPQRGWHPFRAGQLGASLVDSFVYVHPNLRSSLEFWMSLPDDDAYVTPTENYI